MYRDCFETVGRTAGKVATNIAIDRRNDLSINHEEPDDEVPGDIYEEPDEPGSGPTILFHA
jgi:hypothetical protein